MHLKNFSKIKNFLLSELKTLSIVLAMLILYGLIFYFIEIEASIYFFSIYFVIFFIIIYLLIQFFYFEKNNSIKKELISTKKKIASLELEYQEKRQELEDYLIIWNHQMKTPISALELFLKDLDSSKSDDARSELLQIDNYSNMLLNYLKLTSNNNLFITRIRLDDIISYIIKKYSIIFISTETKLIYNPINSYVITDGNWTSIQIEQIINNALKYAKGGTISILYNEKRQELKIEDNGIGINKEDIPKIFNKGYSGYNGQLNQKSSGLGLFIVQKVSDKLNQKVSVKSELGVGTIFTISFRSLTIL